MYGYVYVPEQNKDSVEKYGLLSVKEQVKHGFTGLHTLLQRKYGKQLKEALQMYPELKEKIGKTKYFSIQDYIVYLDWREEITERGADAIYFLYNPIPDSFINEIDDFSSRVLYKVKIPTNWKLIHIGSKKPKNKKEWERLYKNLVSSNENTLWFQNIPHFMVIPPIGKPGVLSVK
jgi:hypothetical protein